jgi:hypothetical protein
MWCRCVAHLKALEQQGQVDGEAAPSWLALVGLEQRAVDGGLGLWQQGTRGGLRYGRSWRRGVYTTESAMHTQTCVNFALPVTMKTIAGG